MSKKNIQIEIQVERGEKKRKPSRTFREASESLLGTRGNVLSFSTGQLQSGFGAVLAAVIQLLLFNLV